MKGRGSRRGESGRENPKGGAVGRRPGFSGLRATTHRHASGGPRTGVRPAGGSCRAPAGGRPDQHSGSALRTTVRGTVRAGSRCGPRLTNAVAMPVLTGRSFRSGREPGRRPRHTLPGTWLPSLDESRAGRMRTLMPAPEETARVSPPLQEEDARPERHSDLRPSTETGHPEGIIRGHKA